MMLVFSTVPYTLVLLHCTTKVLTTSMNLQLYRSSKRKRCTIVPDTFDEELVEATAVVVTPAAVAYADTSVPVYLIMQQHVTLVNLWSEWHRLDAFAFSIPRNGSAGEESGKRQMQCNNYYSLIVLTTILNWSI